MNGCYKVMKTINGRRCDYWQRTWREGRSVKTHSVYIGPAAGPSVGPSTYSASAPRTPEDSRNHFERLSDDFAYLKKYEHAQRREDERIQYGPRAARIRRQEAAVRKAKRETADIKKLNPFIARMLKKE